MRILLLSLLFMLFGQELNKTAQINKLKTEAQEALDTQNFQEAARIYSFMLDSLGVQDDRVEYNLSQAYYQMGEYEQCKPIYQNLTKSEQKSIQSASYLQLGVMAFNEKNQEKALNYFKESLRADASNERARYNYELLKKLSQQQESSQDQSSPRQDIKPSEFAKQIKEKAELLVNENRYTEALKLLQDSKEIDQTVNAYNDYIQRLQTIVEINR